MLRIVAFITFSVLCFSFSLYSADTSPVPVSGYESDVPNLMQVREKVYSGGQPTVEGIRRLKDLGIKLIINLRPHEEPGARDESKEAESYGIQYINIPLTAKTFTQEKMDEFQKLLQEEKHFPVFIHCKSGNRVGGTWLVHRVQQEQAEVAAAIEEAKSMGMVPELEPIVLELLQQSE